MAPKGPKQQPTIDTLRMSEGDTESILNRRDGQSQTPDGCDHRKDTRHRYRTETDLVVTVCHPGGSIMRYAVKPRNISSSGVGFLHGSFLHKDTTCIVSLPTLAGEWIHAVGQVVRCVHVEGRVHEVGVLFRDPIDPSQFVVTDEQPQADDGSDLPKLIGQVLCVEDSVDDRDLIRFMLDRLAVKVLMTSDAEEAVAIFDGGVELDLVLANHHPGALDGLAVIKTLRGKGCELPVVLMTADESEQTHAQAVAQGCNTVLIKPFDLNGLAAVLLQHLPLAEAVLEDANTSVVSSSLWSDEQMRPLILTYLENLSTQVRQLDEMLTGAEPADAVEALCLQIKGTAGGYGYPQISHAAQHLLALNRADEPVEKVQRQCQVLSSLCERACRVRQ